jgi:ABC-type transport system involved in multi-copper enzyme maturation permease subunit
MNKLIMLEFKKNKRTFLYKLLPFVLLAPLLLVLVVYKATPQTNWINIIAKCSVFIQMISFSYIVIAGCYAICRECQDNTLPYLSITQKSIKQILLSKYVFLLLQIWGTQLFIFLVLAFEMF